RARPGCPDPSARHCLHRARFPGATRGRCAARKIPEAPGCAPPGSRRRPHGLELLPCPQIHPDGHNGPAPRTVRQESATAENVSWEISGHDHDCEQLPKNCPIPTPGGRGTRKCPSLRPSFALLIDVTSLAGVASKIGL